MPKVTELRSGRWSDFKISPLQGYTFSRLIRHTRVSHSVSSDSLLWRSQRALCFMKSVYKGRMYIKALVLEGVTYFPAQQGPISQTGGWPLSQVRSVNGGHSNP